MPIFSAIISMGHSVGVKVVVEGVETTDRVAWLQSLIIDMVQGYRLSAPLTQLQVSMLLEISQEIWRKYYIASTIPSDEMAHQTVIIGSVLNEAPKKSV